MLTSTLLVAVGVLVLLLAILILFFRPILLWFAWFAGWTAWIWSKPFLINPKDPTAGLRRFIGLEELSENRIQVVQLGQGESADVLYATWQYGPTVPYKPAGLTDTTSPDPHDRSDFATTMIPGGAPRPDIVYDFGDGVLRDALEVFRREVRKLNRDLVLLSVLALNVRPYAVPFSKLKWRKESEEKGARSFPVMEDGITDHVRINGDRTIVTNSFPVMNDGVEIRFVIQIAWFNKNIMALRFSENPYGLLDNAINAACREWVGSKRLKDAFATKMRARGAGPDKGELEDYILTFLKTRPTIAIIDATGAHKNVPLADAFEWEVTSARVSDTLYATQGDEVKGNKILSDPAATREQGAAVADARKALNEADMEVIGKASDGEADRIRRVALARSGAKVSIFEGVDPKLALAAQTAENTDPSTTPPPTTGGGT